MPDDQSKTPPVEDPRAKLHALGARSFSNAYAEPGGRVVLDMWPEDAEHSRRYSMTPGQAMVLIRGLADAAQRALRESVA